MRLKEDIIKYKANHDNALKKCFKTDNARANVEKNLRCTEQALKNIETDLSLCRQQLAAEKQTSERAIRDKNKIFKTVENLKDTLKKTQQLMEISENTKNKTEAELEQMIQANNAMNKKLQAMENDKEKFSQQIHNLTQQVIANYQKNLKENNEIINELIN